jgi:D-glycero-D-manno-heptose 1,7-bisphosphate phosphatase
MSGEFLDDTGLWCQLLREDLRVGERPALFLDRDGVIVEEVSYLHRSQDVVPIRGAAAAIAAANRGGIPVVVVTNQAGIARGYYGWPEFEEVQETILSKLHANGAVVDAVFACPFHPSHPARKPEPGMLFRAAEMLRLDLCRSWIAGDKSSDLLAGKAAGLRGGVLVLTGYGASHRESAEGLQAPDFDVLIADSIRDLPQLVPILSGYGHDESACYG